MSDTPRTDAAVTLTFAAGHNTVCPNFARTLEREVERWTMECARQHEMAGHLTARAERAEASLKEAKVVIDSEVLRGERFLARAEKAELELATERKAKRDLAGVISGQDKELTQVRERLHTLRVATTELIDVGEEYYDMDCGPNGERAIEAARAALAPK